MAFQGLDRTTRRALSMPTVVVVVAELVVGGVPGEETVDDDEEGMRHGDDRLLVSTMPHDPAVAGSQGAPSVANGAQRCFGDGGAQPRTALRVFPERCFPALSLLPGQSPAQLAKCAAVGNTDMSTPISATMTSAVRFLTPGIEASRSIASVKGAMTTSIC